MVADQLGHIKEAIQQLPEDLKLVFDELLDDFGLRLSESIGTILDEKLGDQLEKFGDVLDERLDRSED